MYNPNAVTSYPSPAIAYEVTLAELKTKPKDEKIAKVFEVLDEVTPKLGVYSKVMSIVRQQLFDAVFSDMFTGSVHSTRNSLTGENISIERKTYVSLYTKIQKEKDENLDSIKKKLEETEYQLHEKIQEIEDSKKKIQSFDGEIMNLNEELKKLNEEIAEKKIEVYRAEKKLRLSREEYESTIENLKGDIEGFKVRIQHSEDEIVELGVYKTAFEEIHSAFAPSIAEEFSRPRRKPIQTTRKNQILTDISNANKLEEQVMTLINISTEEYDKFLEEQNKRLKHGNRGNESSRTTNRSEQRVASQLTDTEINIYNQEVMIEKSNFKRAIGELKNELDLLAQHKKSLEEKLYLIEMDRETSELIKRQRTALSEVQSTKGSLLQGLEEHYEPERKGPDKDQFSAQERILSKWSCMMYTSPNGTNWREMKESKYCDSCGDKTMICPHKVTANETVFKLPPQTSFVKIVRPKVHYNQAVVKQAVEIYKKNQYKIPGSDLQSGEHSVILTNYPAKYTNDFDEHNEVHKILNEGNPEAGFMKTFQILWDDFNNRNNFEKRVARPFTYERTISIFEQFLAFLHEKESYGASVTLSIVDNIYQFFDRRYDIEEVKYSAVYDFYISLYSSATRSKLLEVFCHVLIGNLDRSVLNYLLYLAEMIDKIDWKETEDVKPFFSIIYPFCDDDELDSLTLDFTSFSENKVNKKLVLEFTMNQILARKEFLINEMQFKLSTQTTVNYYMMTEIEFSKSMEEFFYIYDEKQTKVYYETALKYCMSFDGYTFCVPIDKLCYIAAYYYLIQSAQELKQDINDIIREARDKRTQAQVGTYDKSHQHVPWTDEFIKITDIDNLANAIIATSVTKEDHDFDHDFDRKPSMW